MAFFSILSAMDIIKEAQKKGLNPPQYQITTSDIVGDYNKMITFYKHKFPNANLETLEKLKYDENVSLETLKQLKYNENVPKSLEQFHDEVLRFYRILTKMYSKLETDELKKIYAVTKVILDFLIVKIKTMNSQSEQ